MLYVTVQHINLLQNNIGGVIISYIVSINNIFGFGLTREEAENDYYINKCKQDLSNDDENRYVERRRQLHPWMPKENRLHISDVGYLTFEGNVIREERTGKEILPIYKKNSIFFIMSVLFGNILTYEDITVVLREELDAFFNNISTEFISIKDMSTIYISSQETGFIPSIEYNSSKLGVTIGVDKNQIGLCLHGSHEYYVCDYYDNHQMEALSYLGYRTGILLTERGHYTWEQ